MLCVLCGCVGVVFGLWLGLFGGCGGCWRLLGIVGGVCCICVSFISAGLSLVGAHLDVLSISTPILYTSAPISPPTL